MKDKRFALGLGLTAAWLILAFFMFAKAESPSKLNEWGDFFAGFFAPLAFLWLVLGYLQQGEELRQSSEALRLQAAELKNSVEQQSQMVSISREQLKHEIEVFREESVQRREAFRPRFVPEFGGSTGGGTVDSTTYTLRLQNLGAIVTKTICTFDPPLLNHPSIELGVMTSHGSRDLMIRFRPGEVATVMRVSYVDGVGNPGAEIIRINGDGSLISFGPTEREI